MQTLPTPPGLAVSTEQDVVVIRVERSAADAILSVLLHSKFSDGPRIEFLATPFTNKIIEALMTTADVEYMRRREGMQEALAPVVKLVEEWARDENLSTDDAAALMQMAIFPYNVD